MAAPGVVAPPSAKIDESLVHTDVMLFNRCSYDDVSIGDLSVEDYLNATAAKHPTYMSHTAGRYQARRYRKAQCPIVAIKKKDEIERVAKANR